MSYHQGRPCWYIYGHPFVRERVILGAVVSLVSIVLVTVAGLGLWLGWGA